MPVHCAALSNSVTGARGWRQCPDYGQPLPALLHGRKLWGLLLAHGQRVVIDTYTGGDGQSGKRTAATAIPTLYAEAGWNDWRAKASALTLFEWLQPHLGERVGWSQAGFAALASQVTVPPLIT